MRIGCTGQCSAWSSPFGSTTQGCRKVTGCPSGRPPPGWIPNTAGNWAQWRRSGGEAGFLAAANSRFRRPPLIPASWFSAVPTPARCCASCAQCGSLWPGHQPCRGLYRTATSAQDDHPWRIAPERTRLDSGQFLIVRGDDAHEAGTGKDCGAVAPAATLQTPDANVIGSTTRLQRATLRAPIANTGA